MDTTPTHHGAAPPTAPTSGRPQFWREKCYAESSIKLPKHVANMLGEGHTHTRSIGFIVGEINRDPKCSVHVDGAHPPIPIYGLEPVELYDFVDGLAKKASKVTVERVRFGKTEHTKQKASTPTLMACIASWPEEGTPPEEGRVRWEQLVVEACKERFGHRLVSVVAHTDEPHYHLHVIVHNYGASVKTLAMGHMHAAEWAQRGDVEEKSAGQAYKAGASMAQDWFFERVSKPMGWDRKSKSPQPRRERARALAIKAKALQEEEASMAERRAQLQAEIAAAAQQRAELDLRQAELDAKLKALIETETELATAHVIEQELRKAEEQRAADLAAVKRLGFLRVFGR